MICMSFLILAVYAIGFVCALNAFDCYLCDFILFAEFGNSAGQHCSTVCLFRWSTLTAHLLDDFRTLCGKGFYLLGQAYAVVYD